MADDDGDLDAFFDDVDNAVKEAHGISEDTGNAEDARAPSPAPAAKAVVASSVPVVSIAPPLPALAPSAGGDGGVDPSIYSSPPPAPPPPLPLPPPRHWDGTAKPHARSAAGAVWSDPTLAQWPADDFRLFVGNLAKDLKQHHLEQHFKARYPSFAMARIMCDKADGKSRGYGFVSLLDAKDCARAIREMDQSWLGSRPIKVKLSEWKDREWKEVRKRGKAEKRKKKRQFGDM